MGKELDIKREIELKRIALELKISIIKMISHAKSGHPGGSLSATDIVTVLYFEVMNFDANTCHLPERDRFVLSKGHAAPLLYAVLARIGCLPHEKLMTLRKTGSDLQGHPNMLCCPGVEVSTGSLGQGLSVAHGMALAARLNKKQYRVYALLGDGEVQEGQIWEAAMSAAHYRTDNLCAILDNNDLQIDGNVRNIKNVHPLADKWRAFGWNVISIHGHNYMEIYKALGDASEIKGKPSIIIAKTVKGNGVSFMENVVSFHGKAPDSAQTEIALRELENQLKSLN